MRSRPVTFALPAPVTVEMWAVISPSAASMTTTVFLRDIPYTWEESTSALATAIIDPGEVPEPLMETFPVRREISVPSPSSPPRSNSFALSVMLYDNILSVFIDPTASILPRSDPAVMRASNSRGVPLNALVKRTSPNRVHSGISRPGRWALISRELATLSPASRSRESRDV